MHSPGILLVGKEPPDGLCINKDIASILRIISRRSVKR